MTRFHKTFWLVVLAAGLALCAARGTSVRLEWGRSPSTNVIVDYRVHYGGAPRSYTNLVHAGTNLTVWVTNLLGGRTYYFAASCMDVLFQCSDYSAEVSTVTPEAPTNVVTVALRVLTNAGLTGSWGTWLTLPVRAVTNPAAPLFYRAAMGVTATNPNYQVLKLDSRTLAFTNR